MHWSQKNPTDTAPDRLSKDFGVPHSALLFTNARGLLNMKPPPAFGGNASRLLAQSWESDNLYWARLADEMGYSPVMLNVLVPALTRRMVVNIFASNIDDWPALFRAMRETGDEFRQWKDLRCRCHYDSQQPVNFEERITGMVMVKKHFACFGILAGLFCLGSDVSSSQVQDDPTHLRVNVVLVQLNVAVTDSRGNYVTGLRPEDFAVTEDMIPQKVSTFEESSESGHSGMETARRDPTGPAGPVEPPSPSSPSEAATIAISRVAESSLFILFDTSNYMYRGFVFAQDAIADFIRSMDESSKIAFYSYSRNLPEPRR